MTMSLPPKPTLTTASAAVPSRVIPAMTHLASFVLSSHWRSTISPVRTMFSRSRMLRLSSSIPQLLGLKQHASAWESDAGIV